MKPQLPLQSMLSVRLAQVLPFSQVLTFSSLTFVNSGFKVNDHAILYDGQFRVLFSVQSIMDFGRPLNNATTGWIQSDAEPGFRKHAISGWRPGSGNHDILDSAVYKESVFKTAEDISFYIPGHRFDNNWKVALEHHVGRFNACHVVCIFSQRSWLICC